MLFSHKYKHAVLNLYLFIFKNNVFSGKINFMNYITVLVLMFIFNNILAQSYSGPESVEYDYNRNCYYISNTQSHQIIKRDIDATLTIFASGIATGPHGLEIIDDTLYACAGNMLIAYNLNNGNIVFSQNLGATFLNGITHKANNLYISDFTAKKVYRFNVLTKQYNEFVTSLNKSPNGIIYDDINDRLVMVSWGSNAPVLQISLNDSTVTQLTTTSLGNCDGIAMNCNGQFFVSSWSPNRISRFENDFVAAPVNMNASGLSNPADIFFNTDTDTLAVPNSGNNNVNFYNYSSCNALSVEEQLLTYNVLTYDTYWQLIINQFNLTEAALFDVTGKLINTTVNNGNVIDVQKPVNTGIYILKIKTSNQITTIKLCHAY